VIAGVAAGLLASLMLTLGELRETIGRFDEAAAHFERSLVDCRRAEQLAAPLLLADATASTRR
jgi:hypothetical protein